MSVTAAPAEAAGSAAGATKLVLAHATHTPVGTTPLADALSLDVGFTCSRDVTQARWKVRPSPSPTACAPCSYAQGCEHASPF